MHSPSPYWPATATLPQSRSSSSITLVDDDVYPAPDALVNSDELPVLVAGKITQPVINYLVDRVCDAVVYGLNRPSSSSSSPTSARSWCHSRRDKPEAERAAFTEFVATVLRRAEVTLSAVIGALVYIDRAKPHLSIAIEEWAHHRVLLGGLIVASKYLNDASLKNAHWALCTGVFGRRDVQRIEREFLGVLAWELAISEQDLVRIGSRMVREGALVLPICKAAEPVASLTKEVQMDVDVGKRSSDGSLRMVRALWDEKARRDREREQMQAHSSHRMERKRSQADVDMDVDGYEERPRRRRSVYPSPTSSSDACSTCTAASSPATDSDDSISPCTPPPPHQASLGQHYSVPGSTAKSLPLPHPGPMLAKSVSSGSTGSYQSQPLTLLTEFPSVPHCHPQPAPVPTPALELSPVQAPTAPPPLPSLPPYAAYPLSRAFPASHPHLHLRPHSARPSSPYAKPSLSAGSGSRSRPVTPMYSPYGHKRSSAMSSMSMMPSLYPAYIPAANA